ncbi:hypothetical protein [Daejeonella sp.]|uniref:hypothetical protein n=1 Tax=Daejeonella sp. TaxID=2805397 RepID=UPI00273217B4|nr:hypothetical protein [Daejeonella sp.]MDP2413840.1 hypothetical protein [Daejeonella sp.]
MKKLILGFIMIVLANNVFCQDLLISNLIHLRTLDAISANDYLSKRGWQFKSSSEMGEEGAAVASWVFPNTPHQVSLINDFKNSRFIASFDTTNKGFIDRFKIDLLAKSAKLVESKIGSDSIQAEYSFNNLRVLFVVQKEDEITRYTIYVVNPD